jgi:hypothetical protein
LEALFGQVLVTEEVEHRPCLLHHLSQQLAPDASVQRGR